MSTAVFDVGKTNVKLFVADPDGALLASVSTPNPVYPGPPYVHHDLRELEDWLFDALRELGTRHTIDAMVTCAHGSGGVLVGDDGPAMPMVDYEQAPPAAVDAEYKRTAGPFSERESPFMLGTAHVARQMLWLETEWPEVFAQARYFLTTPQYWAWRLSGVAASEVTSLAAQSHLWNAIGGRATQIVKDRHWERLMPPFRPAWATLGPIKPELAARAGLSKDVRVVNGIHDSTANLYRYQAAGLSDMTVVSTGTWIVPISTQPGPSFAVERPGLCCNADVEGRPLPGMLTMGGREFSGAAADASGPASRAQLDRIVASRTMALPSFGTDDCLFPGTSRRGRFEGPMADDRDARFTLALLYCALLTDRCLQSLTVGDTIVLDGSFVRDPLYGAIVAALNPTKRVLVNLDPYGTATGAALLATHETRTDPAPLSVQTPNTQGLPDLAAYRAAWQERAEHQETNR